MGKLWRMGLLDLRIRAGGCAVGDWRMGERRQVFAIFRGGDLLGVFVVLRTLRCRTDEIPISSTKAVICHTSTSATLTCSPACA